MSNLINTIFCYYYLWRYKYLFGAENNTAFQYAPNFPFSSLYSTGKKGSGTNNLSWFHSEEMDVANDIFNISLSVYATIMQEEALS